MKSYREMLAHLAIWSAGAILACRTMYRHVLGEPVSEVYLFLCIILPVLGTMCYCIESFVAKAKLRRELERRRREDELMEYKPSMSGLRHPIPPDGF